jgi:uncharacterized protein with PIN domain
LYEGNRDQVRKRQAQVWAGQYQELCSLPVCRSSIQWLAATKDFGDGTMNREQRRAMAKQAKKDGNEDVVEKVALFGKLGDACLVCNKPFDKKDKEMVMSWNVVVREVEEKVNLYCPDCWNGAIELLNEIKHDLLGEE